VFEGKRACGHPRNQLLAARFGERRVLSPPPTAHAWLGAPNAIKGPTEVTFHRQSGNHLLIVGQREEAALTMLGISLLGPPSPNIPLALVDSSFAMRPVPDP
jgi:hypothetical protein